MRARRLALAHARLARWRVEGLSATWEGLHYDATRWPYVKWLKPSRELPAPLLWRHLASMEKRLAAYARDVTTVRPARRDGARADDDSANFQLARVLAVASAKDDAGGAFAVKGFGATLHLSLIHI